jgi:hypothetical protein
MRPTTSPMLVLSLLLNKIWCETILFQLGPFDLLWHGLIGLATRLLNRWYMDVFFEFSLLNLSVTIRSSTMFILMHYNNWNTFVKLGCVDWNHMASHIQHLNSLSTIPF